MWLFFAAAAAASALLSLAWLGRGKSGKRWSFLSLSFTVLYLCALYAQAARWAAAGDLAALQDVLPSDSAGSRVLSALSLLLNAPALLRRD